MPIQLQIHAASDSVNDTFAKTLRDDPDHARALRQAIAAGHTIAGAHFNGQPVAVAALDGEALLWMVVHPSTRGRGVGKDFLRLLEQHQGAPLSLPPECRRPG